jgi:hypothetical protein
MKQLLFYEAGVLHADHHTREQDFQRARRREIKRRADLAQIGHRRLGVLGTCHAEAGHQALRVIEVMIADPGKRQISERHVLFGKLVEIYGIGSRRDRALVAEHDAFRRAGRAGRIKNDGGIGTFRRLDLGPEPGAQARIFGQRLTPVLDHRVHRMQKRLIVIAQAPRLVVEHALELRQLLLHRADFVDLLLVFDGGKSHLRVREHVGKFLRHRVGIDRYGSNAEHLRGHDRPVELGPVRADDGEGFSTFQAKAVQPGGIGAHILEHLRPRPSLPNAEVLVAHSGAGAVQIRVADQQLGKGIRQTRGGRRHSLILPAAARNGMRRHFPRSGRVLHAIFYCLHMKTPPERGQALRHGKKA